MTQATDAKSPSLILWGAGTSRTLRAHWALAELGLEYQRRPIQPRTGETQTDEYTALTARQKVPLLQDGALVLTESAAIVMYLSDTYAHDGNRLVPLEPVARARCMEWCFFVISELDATSLYVMRRHGDLKHIYGDAPQANLAAAEYFGKQMRSVDRALADGRSCLMGDRFGAPDILLSTCIAWAVKYGVAVSDRALAYQRGLVARPGFALAEQRNTPPGSV